MVDFPHFLTLHYARRKQEKRREITRRSKVKSALKSKIK
jgi:hypothetical protein